MLVAIVALVNSGSIAAVVGHEVRAVILPSQRKRSPPKVELETRTVKGAARQDRSHHRHLPQNHS
jgi:hypothetical protein